MIPAVTVTPIKPIKAEKSFVNPSEEPSMKALLVILVSNKMKGIKSGIVNTEKIAPLRSACETIAAIIVDTLDNPIVPNINIVKKEVHDTIVMSTKNMYIPKVKTLITRLNAVLNSNFPENTDEPDA